VVGDFNMTPWSPYFPEILRVSGLKNSLVGAGFQPSWPSWLPALLRIPIDHALVSEEFEVVERKVGPHIGSDHRPLIIKIALPND
jgi:endonuclease/exonuclease/phosphatase (EEP) superfamily protein YafD